MKRILAFFCALSLLLSGFPALVSSAAETETVADGNLIEIAAEPKEMFPDLRPNAKHLFGSIPLENDLPNGFVDYLQTHFGNCETQFSIAEFNIPYSRFDDLRFVIWYEMPELFHVYSLGCNYDISTNTITDLGVTYQPYADTAAEYKVCLDKMISGAEYLLQGVKGNKNLTDVEKALILHDRLAIWTEYDLAGSEAMDPGSPIFGAYSALGEGLSVCQGYSMAYMYLLEQAGIESDLCSSEQLCHAWNIVYIDDVAYHVDVTWDDPVNGATATYNDNYGRALHDNFLRSSDGIWSTGHKAYDYSTAPRDPRYDNNSATTWWKNSNTAIQLIGNKLYYQNSISGDVVDPDNGDQIHTHENYYTSYTLSSAGGMLLCASTKDVHAVDPKTGASSVVYTPTTGLIQGMKYEKEKLYIQLTDNNGNVWRESINYVVPEMPDAPDSADYIYTVSNGEATITGYTGDGGDITIPTKLGGYPVAAIGGEAFYCNSMITGVTIPGTVKRIDDNAFFNCANMVTLTLGEGVQEIGSSAFFACDKLKNLVAPDSITKIESEAFCLCGSLQSVTLGKGVRTIESGAFSQCAKLMNIQVDPDNAFFRDVNGVLFSGTTLVQYPSGLSGSYTVPAGTTAIGASAFSWSDYLTEVTLPDSVKTIDYHAFWYSGIKKIQLGKNLETIGYGAFELSSLAEIQIPDSVTTIESSAFSECGWLNTVRIGRGVKTIGYSAFLWCELKTVNYAGTQAQWNEIAIGEGNEGLLNANIVYEGDHTHSYAKKVTKPTCTAKGYTTYTCACGDTYKGDYVNALGHTYKSGSCIRCKYKPAGAKITTQPKNVAVSSGKTATVNVKASGTGLKYTWYYAKKGAKSYTKASSTTNSYSLKMSTSYNGTKVYCVVSDAYGNSVKSAVVTLYKGTPAKITTQPKSTTVANGKTGSITLKASGSSLKYQWYIKYKGASSFAKVGKSSKTYSFKMASKLDGAQVYCVVKDKYGIEVKSSVVTIKMPVQPKITTQPKSVKAFSGKTVKFTVKASGEGLKYQWYYAKKGSNSFKKLSAKSATYSVKVSSSVDGRKYYCLVTDKYGQTVKSSVVTLTMQRAAKILTQPKNVSVKNGKAAKVTIKAEGDGLKYTWYYLLAGETKYRKAAFTGNTFSVTMAAKYKNTKVYCAISDQYGNSVKSKTVTLKMK